MFDGFYTLLVSNRDSFAVVRDAIACKPAVIAETDDWVAMGSEYRALAGLPGVETGQHLGARTGGDLRVDTMKLVTHSIWPTNPLREVNAALHAPGLSGEFVIANPDGAHNVAVGVDAPVRVTVEGHVGYYSAGMNQQAEITIDGNAGTGVAENMMSGTVWVKGDARSRRAQPPTAGCWSSRAMRLPVRYFDEGRRHRGRGQRRPHERLHGAGRAAGDIACRSTRSPRVRA